MKKGGRLRELMNNGKDPMDAILGDPFDEYIKSVGNSFAGMGNPAGNRFDGH